jgi:lipopolysaccharide/colanic/teichoic acid biosynthesis glycosyltransferase
MGELNLIRWADASHWAKKPAYLRLPGTSQLPQKQHPIRWGLKRIFDWIVAALLLVFLSPLMLWITLLMTVFSPGPIFFYQWRVGERGKLFRIIKFRTMKVGAEQLHHQIMGGQPGLHKLKDDPRITPLGRWMRRYSLDELPQLINVLRGEMSLVGPRPWAIYDAVRISPDLQHRLNALPGMTGAWQVQSRSTVLDLGTVNRGDLRYLSGWSLWKDFWFLLLTIPKVIAGFGAY